MGLTRLGIRNLRCIESAELELGQGRNFLIGANGAGKTSILEAVHLLGRGRSFRTRQIGRLVRLGESELAVFGDVVQRPAGTIPERARLGVAFGVEGLASRIDGSPTESLADLARLFAVHVIDPKLHSLIEAGPSERRRFIDAGVFHVEHNYLGCWRDYRRILSQRNAALKSGRLEQVTPWTEPFVRAGKAVDRLRSDYVGGLAAAFRTTARDLLGLELELDYRCGWKQGIGLGEALERSLERDRATGATQVGPHRGDIELSFAGGSVRALASRGQQKLVAAALVLAQVREFERRTGRAGTLLVDDPAAELDDASLVGLLAAIRRVDAQTLITGLRLAGLEPGDGEPVFHVERGNVNRVIY